MSPQRDYDDPIQQFLSWQERARRIGYRKSSNGDDQARYISLKDLRAHFKDSRHLKRTLEALFKDDTQAAPPADLVWDKYLRVLAILISIKQGPMIVQFTNKDMTYHDEKLPFAPQQANFPHASDCDLPKLFCEKQWQYCPVETKRFMEYELNDNYILPFCVEEPKDTGGSAYVYKIKVDEEYNELHPTPTRTEVSRHDKLFKPRHFY